MSTVPSSVLAVGGRPTTIVVGGSFSVPVSSLPVVSTVGFPTTGQITVNTLVGGLYQTQQIDYTGIVAGAFTGCTGWTAGTTGGGAEVDLVSVLQFSYVTRGGVTLYEYVGPNFTLMTVTGATGVPQVGDVLQEAVTGATVTVAQVIQTGATTIIFGNGFNGTFAGNQAISTLSGTGTLAGTGSSALPLGGATNNSVLSYNGAILAVIGNYVVRFDGTYWTIVFTMSPADTGGTRHTGLYVFYVRNRPLLGFVWGDPTISQTWRATSRDGITWTKALLNGSAGLGGLNTGIPRQIRHNNVLYFSAPGNTLADDPVHQAWDPSDDTLTKIFGSTATGQPRPGGGGGSIAGAPGYVQDFASWKGFLIMIAQDGDLTASLYKLVGTGAGATWSRILSFAETGNIANSGGFVSAGVWSLFTPGDSLLYAIYYATNGNNAAGWLVQQVTDTGGGVYLHSQVQGATFPTTPAPGPPTQFNGYIYPEGNLNTAFGSWAVNVDNTIAPGSPRTLFHSNIAEATFGPSFTPAFGVQTFQWNGPTNQVTDLQSGLAEDVYPTSRGSGGEYLWNNTGIAVNLDMPRPDILVEDVQYSGSNILFAVTMPNISTTVATGSPLALPQATIPVASTEGFSTSGTILVTSDAGVQSVSYTGITANSFTGSSGGTGNISNGSLVQGTQTLEFLFSSNGEPPETAMTLTSTSRGAISGNTILAVPADGAETIVGWGYTTDGVSPFSVTDVQVSIANGYAGTDGIGGPPVEFLVDPVNTERAGPLSTFAVDFQAAERAGPLVTTVPDLAQNRRAGPVGGALPDIQQTSRAGPVAGVLPDLQQTRRAGAVGTQVTDLQAQERAGPLATFLARFPIKGEKVVGGDVLGTELEAGVVHGEF